MYVEKTKGVQPVRFRYWGHYADAYSAHVYGIFEEGWDLRSIVLQWNGGNHSWAEANITGNIVLTKWDRGSGKLSLNRIPVLGIGIQDIGNRCSQFLKDVIFCYSYRGVSSYRLVLPGDTSETPAPNPKKLLYSGGPNIVGGRWGARQIGANYYLPSNIVHYFDDENTRKGVIIGVYKISIGNITHNGIKVLLPYISKRLTVNPEGNSYIPATTEKFIMSWRLADNCDWRVTNPDGLQDLAEKRENLPDKGIYVVPDYDGQYISQKIRGARWGASRIYFSRGFDPLSLLYINFNRLVSNIREVRNTIDVRGVYCIGKEEVVGDSVVESSGYCKMDSYISVGEPSLEDHYSIRTSHYPPTYVDVDKLNRTLTWRNEPGYEVKSGLILHNLNLLVDYYTWKIILDIPSEGLLTLDTDMSDELFGCIGVEDDLYIRGNVEVTTNWLRLFSWGERPAIISISDGAIISASSGILPNRVGRDNRNVKFIIGKEAFSNKWFFNLDMHCLWPSTGVTEMQFTLVLRDWVQNLSIQNYPKGVGTSNYDSVHLTGIYWDVEEEVDSVEVFEDDYGDTWGKCHAIQFNNSYEEDDLPTLVLIRGKRRIFDKETGKYVGLLTMTQSAEKGFFLQGDIKSIGLERYHLNDDFEKVRWVYEPVDEGTQVMPDYIWNPVLHEKVEGTGILAIKGFLGGVTSYSAHIICDTYRKVQTGQISIGDWKSIYCSYVEDIVVGDRLANIREYFILDTDAERDRIGNVSTVTYQNRLSTESQFNLSVKESGNSTTGAEIVFTKNRLGNIKAVSSVKTGYVKTPSLLQGRDFGFPRVGYSLMEPTFVPLIEDISNYSLEKPYTLDWANMVEMLGESTPLLRRGGILGLGGESSNSIGWVQAYSHPKYAYGRWWMSTLSAPSIINHSDWSEVCGEEPTVKEIKLYKVISRRGCYHFGKETPDNSTEHINRIFRLTGALSNVEVAVMRYSQDRYIENVSNPNVIDVLNTRGASGRCLPIIKEVIGWIPVPGDTWEEFLGNDNVREATKISRDGIEGDLCLRKNVEDEWLIEGKAVVVYVEINRRMYLYVGESLKQIAHAFEKGTNEGEYMFYRNSYRMAIDYNSKFGLEDIEKIKELNSKIKSSQWYPNTGNILLDRGVQYIPPFLFKDCQRFERVFWDIQWVYSMIALGDSVRIGESAFEGCRNLREFNPPRIIRLEEREGQELSYGIGHKASQLPNSMFPLNRNNKRGTTGRIIGDVGDRAFYGCSDLMLEVSTCFILGKERIGMSPWEYRVRHGKEAFKKVRAVSVDLSTKNESWGMMPIGATMVPVNPNLRNIICQDTFVYEIGESAFEGVGIVEFKRGVVGEQYKPPTALIIGNRAFKDTYYVTGDLILPEMEYVRIGDEAFAGNRYGVDIKFPSKDEAWFRIPGNYVETLKFNKDSRYARKMGSVSVGKGAFRNLLRGVLVPGISSLPERWYKEESFAFTRPGMTDSDNYGSIYIDTNAFEGSNTSEISIRHTSRLSKVIGLEVLRLVGGGILDNSLLQYTNPNSLVTLNVNDEIINMKAVDQSLRLALSSNGDPRSIWEGNWIGAGLDWATEELASMQFYEMPRQVDRNNLTIPIGVAEGVIIRRPLVGVMNLTGYRDIGSGLVSRAIKATETGYGIPAAVLGNMIDYQVVDDPSKESNTYLIINEELGNEGHLTEESASSREDPWEVHGYFLSEAKERVNENTSFSNLYKEISQSNRRMIYYNSALQEYLHKVFAGNFLSKGEVESYLYNRGWEVSGGIQSSNEFIINGIKVIVEESENLIILEVLDPDNAIIPDYTEEPPWVELTNATTGKYWDLVSLNPKDVVSLGSGSFKNTNFNSITLEVDSIKSITQGFVNDVYLKVHQSIDMEVHGEGVGSCIIEPGTDKVEGEITAKGYLRVEIDSVSVVSVDYIAEGIVKKADTVRVEESEVSAGRLIIESDTVETYDSTEDTANKVIEILSPNKVKISGPRVVDDVGPTLRVISNNPVELDSSNLNGTETRISKLEVIFTDEFISYGRVWNLSNVNSLEVFSKKDIEIECMGGSNGEIKVNKGLKKLIESLKVCEFVISEDNIYSITEGNSAILDLRKGSSIKEIFYGNTKLGSSQYIRLRLDECFF